MWFGLRLRLGFGFVLGPFSGVVTVKVDRVRVKVRASARARTRVR